MGSIKEDEALCSPWKEAGYMQVFMEEVLFELGLDGGVGVAS